MDCTLNPNPTPYSLNAEPYTLPQKTQTLSQEPYMLEVLETPVPQIAKSPSKAYGVAKRMAHAFGMFSAMNQ